jgi:hypothetical protein
MAEGAQATAGATLNGNIVGAPNLFFSNPFAGAVTNGALNFAVGNDEYMRDSYIQQWNLNVQRKTPRQRSPRRRLCGKQGHQTGGDVRRSQPPD